MEDVTGFNQRNGVNDGERLVEQGLKKLKVRYSDHIIEIIRLMLKFEESDRPSFVELSKLVLTSTENTLESPKPGVGKPLNKTNNHQAKNNAVQERKVSKTFSMQNFKDGIDNGQNQAQAEAGAHAEP